MSVTALLARATAHRWRHWLRGGARVDTRDVPGSGGSTRAREAVWVPTVMHTHFRGFHTLLGPQNRVFTLPGPQNRVFWPPGTLKYPVFSGLGP